MGQERGRPLRSLYYKRKKRWLLDEAAAESKIRKCLIAQV